MEAKALNEEQPPRLAKSMIDAGRPFLVGCVSGTFATVCIQPFDTVKVRMQLVDRTADNMTPLTMARAMVSDGGVRNLYSGLSAALVKQVIYGTTRLGLFATFERQIEQRANERGQCLGFGGRALASLGAGSIAAFVSNPTDISLVRMQADGLQPVAIRRNYSSVFDAVRRITRQEGFLALWKGAAPAIVRAMSTNFGQLAFFSESKHQIQKHTSISPAARTALAASIAGLASAVLSLPFDFVKTRMQNQSMGTAPSGLPRYSGSIHCFITTIQTEGYLRFYRDFTPIS